MRLTRDVSGPLIDPFQLFKLSTPMHFHPSSLHRSRAVIDDKKEWLLRLPVMIRKPGAEIYHGSEICKKKTMELLEQAGLPNGLILLDDIHECGYVRETGFVWMKRNKKVEHEFKAIGRLVQYDAEINGYVEQHKIRKVSGVKSKELLVWITISEISIEDPSNGKICFKSAIAVINKSFPVGALEIEENDKK